MFAVFGVSRVEASQKAWEKMDDSSCYESWSDFLNAHTALMNEIYEKQKPTRISPVYSSRATAQLFMQTMIEMNEGRDLEIRQGARETEELNPKTGKKYPVRWK